jgi:hypothetical protein
MVLSSNSSTKKKEKEMKRRLNLPGTDTRPLDVFTYRLVPKALDSVWEILGAF